MYYIADRKIRRLLFLKAKFHYAIWFGAGSKLVLTDSSTESPVHDLMLSIQAVRGLHCLREPGIVPCIISFSRQFPCLVMV